MFSSKNKNIDGIMTPSLLSDMENSPIISKQDTTDLINDQGFKECLHNHESLRNSQNSDINIPVMTGKLINMHSLNW